MSRSVLTLRDGALSAGEGGCRYAVTEDGIPDLFAPSADAGQRKVEEANVAFHDGHSEDYDRLTVRPDEDYFAVSETLERLCRQHGKARELLDAGCGSGVVLKRGRPLFEHIVGVDLSLGMLRRCLRVHGDLARASVLALPLADASLDAVTGYSLLHHLHDPAEAFREFHRVLRPGGFLYTDNDSNAAFHARFGWWLKIRRAAKPKRTETEADAALERVAECHHDKGLEPDSLRRRLLEAGFSRAEIVYAHPPRPDDFTRLLIQLQEVDASPGLWYYFRLIAWK